MISCNICKRSLWSVWFALFCSFVSFGCGMCKGPKADNKIEKSKSACKHDSFYDNDIIMRGGNDTFRYPPKQFPVVGKTTEKEIYEMYKYNKNPNIRFSFKKPLTLNIKGKKIRVDRYLRYTDYKVLESRNRTKDGNYSYHRTHKKYIKFYIFLHEKVVVFYTTSHWVKTSKNKWKPGKFHNGYSNELRGEKYPGHTYLRCSYWLQRPDAICHISKKYTQVECDNDLKNSRPWR